MKRVLSPEMRDRMRTYRTKVVSTLDPWLAGLSSRWGELVAATRERSRRLFTKSLPPLAITHIQPPALLVLMGGTMVSQYEDAGQIGRLAAALERHTRFFRTVILMTPDHTDYTQQLAVERVHHVRMLLPLRLTRSAPLLASALLHYRTVRHVTSVLVMDEAAAPAGWLAGSVARAPISMSVGAPWAPPRDPNVDGKSKWLMRAALRRVEQIVEWPGTRPAPQVVQADPAQLPELVDADLFCPLTTTDPTRPRTVGVFVNADHEADARVVMGVSERLVRRGKQVVMRAFVFGHGAEARAASLQAEATQRGLIVEFRQLPQDEMVPDVIAHMRMCVSFTDPESVRYLLRAMASGVPVIAAGRIPEATGGADWTRFVLQSAATEDQVTRSIEALFREPGVRLRMAREGRRFVVARHSLDALSAMESKLLRGPDEFSIQVVNAEPEFDAEGEAEKLAMMFEATGVEQSDDGDEEPGLEGVAA